MARPSREQPLNVFLNGKQVGLLHDGEAGVLLEYAASAPRISFSLPTDGSLDAHVFSWRSQAFFDNLLPEGDGRRFIARNAGIAEYRFFSLLRAVGREFVGAIILSDKDEVPSENGDYRDATRRPSSKM